MIPDAGNRTVTIKLEHSSAVPPKYFTTEVVGWRQLNEECSRYTPMVWNQWTMTAMPFGNWMSGAVVKHSDDTDTAWSVTYKGLDTATINVRVEQP